MPAMNLPVRTVIVELGNKEVMISPGSKIAKDQFKSQWPVSDIVAPNAFHHAGVKNASLIYPEAKLWYVPGLEEKCKDAKWTSLLTEKNWPYQKDLAVIPIGGMPDFNEVVFFHYASQSLIVTDLCFNMLGSNGMGAWIIQKLFGTYNRFAISRYFMKYVKDRPAFASSMKNILSYDFVNIVVSHGENIIGSTTLNAKQHLKYALGERGIIVSP